jgi:1-deoxy-D-xylulose 5-phosphate reductoisomerase
MKIPIAYSLGSNYFFNQNDRNKLLFNAKHLNELSFYKVNKKQFPSTRILSMNKVLNQTGYILINSLNEILVGKFMRNEILFTDIVSILYGLLKSKLVKNYLKENRIQHINDVFKAYNFCKILLNK